MRQVILFFLLLFFMFTSVGISQEKSDTLYFNKVVFNIDKVEKEFDIATNSTDSLKVEKAFFKIMSFAQGDESTLDFLKTIEQEKSRGSGQYGSEVEVEIVNNTDTHILRFYFNSRVVDINNSRLKVGTGRGNILCIMSDKIIYSLDVEFFKEQEPVLVINR